MAIRFQKLYADLITDAGVVCVAYVADLVAWGKRSRHAGLELYHPDGTREVRHALDVERTINDARTHLLMRFTDGTFELEHRHEHGAWQPDGAPPCPGIDWRVRAARTLARAKLLDRELVGSGYSDWVELDRAPRSLGLVELRWGRVHLPDETIVFDALTFEGRTPYQRALSISATGRTTEHGVFSFEDRDDGTLLHLAGRSPIALTAVRALHVGDAVDRERFPRAIDRFVSRALSGNVTERRTLARVDGWLALHEQVRFGRAAAVTP